MRRRREFSLFSFYFYRFFYPTVFVALFDSPLCSSPSFCGGVFWWRRVVVVVKVVVKGEFARVGGTQE
jgi:hypothetical protein